VIIRDKYDNLVIEEQPVLMTIMGQGQTLYHKFSANSPDSYSVQYTLPTGDMDDSKCGWYSLSNFLLVQGGLEASYYTNRWFSGEPYLQRYDPEIDFNWEIGEVIPGVASNYVSVIWEGFLTVDSTDDYIFTIKANDGYRLTLDQRVVLDNLTPVSDEVSGHSEYSQAISLAANQFIPFKLEYFENINKAFVILKYRRASQSSSADLPVPSTWFYYKR
jgi:hypothetical protein